MINKLKIACLMVTYNRSHLLHKILSQIQSFSWDYSRFVIVNNASHDDTSEILLELMDSLGLEVISLPENLGHGAGLAQGLRMLNETGEKIDYVVFLEDDSIPQKGYLDFLTEAIKLHSFTMISSGGYLVRLGKRINLSPQEGEILDVDFGLFDGAIAKFKDLMKVGFPVEDWFMMFDDFEYCYRIRKAGYKIGVIHNPYLGILHEGWGGGSSYSHLWRSYYQSRNFILFVRKHLTLFTFWDALILNSKRLLGGLFSKNGWRVTKLRLLGYRAGFLGKTGKSLDLKTLKEF